MLLGLIGDNIASSKAPRLHALAGGLCGIHVQYDLLVPAQLHMTFDEVFAACEPDRRRGINITYPYKEKAAAKVVITDPLVAAMGAVNTVLFEQQGPQGFNTDYTGFISAYGSVMGQQGPGSVVLIGAGGVGKAVGFGLVRLGASAIRIVDLDGDKAAGLAKALRAVTDDVAISVVDDPGQAAAGADGIVNCTPLGMAGIGGSALPRHCMAGASWAFDAVYTPANTPFLCDAAAEGLTIVSGYELFFFQGVHAWKLFSGHEVDECSLRAMLALPES